MTLREQLAEKLMKLHDRLDKPFDVPGGIMSRSRNEVWGRVADECIRQMEWARHGSLEPVIDARLDAPRWAYETMEAIKELPLTLAPEDWTP